MNPADFFHFPFASMAMPPHYSVPTFREELILRHKSGTSLSRSLIGPKEKGRANHPTSRGLESRTMKTSRAGLATLLLVSSAACGPVRLTVDDAVIASSDNTFPCVAYLQREPIFGVRRFAPGSRIDFKIGDRTIASADTDESGRAATSASLASGDPSRLEAVAKVGGARYRGTASIYRWQDRRTIVAIDIDRTISRTDFDHLILSEGEDDRSTPLVGSRRALASMGSDCRFVYVTARPRFLLEKTRLWLTDEEFPPGPVIASTGLREAIQRTEYKLEVLAELRTRWSTLLVGIGNSESDEEAYQKSGLLTLLVNQKSIDTDDPKTYRFRNWRALGHFYESNRDLFANPDRLASALKNNSIRSLLRHHDQPEASQPVQVNR